MLKTFFCHFSDVDECSLNTHDCNANAICTNTEGSFTCKCDISAHYIGDGKTCTPHRKPNDIFNALCSIRFTTLLIVNFYLWKKLSTNLYVANEQALACLPIILIMLLSNFAVIIDAL